MPAGSAKVLDWDDTDNRVPVFPSSDRRVNRLEDSYLLWKSVCQCKLLSRAQVSNRFCFSFLYSILLASIRCLRVCVWWSHLTLNFLLLLLRSFYSSTNAICYNKNYSEAYGYATQFHLLEIGRMKWGLLRNVCAVFIEGCFRTWDSLLVLVQWRHSADVFFFLCVLDFQQHFKEIQKQSSPVQRTFYVHLTSVVDTRSTAATLGLGEYSLSFLSPSQIAISVADWLYSGRVDSQRPPPTGWFNVTLRPHHTVSALLLVVVLVGGWGLMESDHVCSSNILTSVSLL